MFTQKATIVFSYKLWRLSGGRGEGGGGGRGGGGGECVILKEESDSEEK